MTYDGETVRIKATITDFDGASVGSSQVTNAVLNLYDASGNYVYVNQALSWEPVHLYWYFDWQNALPGTFTAQCVFEGAGFEVFDYTRVRIKSLKIEPTGNPTPIINDPNDP